MSAEKKSKKKPKKSKKAKKKKSASSKSSSGMRKDSAAISGSLCDRTSGAAAAFLESQANPDVEMWLIKAPEDFDASMFNNRSLSVQVSGGQTSLKRQVLESKSDSMASYSLETSSSNEYQQILCLTQGGRSGELRPCKSFSHQLDILEFFGEKSSEGKLDTSALTQTAYARVAQHKSLPYRLRLLCQENVRVDSSKAKKRASPDEGWDKSTSVTMKKAKKEKKKKKKKKKSNA